MSRHDTHPNHDEELAWRYVESRSGVDPGESPIPTAAFLAALGITTPVEFGDPRGREPWLTVRLGDRVVWVHESTGLWSGLVVLASLLVDEEELAAVAAVCIADGVVELA